MAALKIHKQELFAQNYAQHGNGTRAAIAAGYGEAGAAPAASRLIRDPAVKARIAELKQKVTAATLARVSADRGWVMEKLVENAESALAAKDRAAANRALELVGKELGMFIDRKMEVQSPLDGLSAEQLQALLAFAEKELARPTIDVSPAPRKAGHYSDTVDVIEEKVIEGTAEGAAAPEPAPIDPTDDAV